MSTTKRTRATASRADAVRALAYCRVSTAEQGADGFGMAAQEHTITAEVERRGWQLAHVYRDVASAKSSNGRHGLAAALERLSRGEAQAFVVAKLDRLARSTLDFASIMERSQREGWRLVILDPDIDLVTPFGRAMAGVIAVFAQLEREMISERTRLGLEEARRQGKRIGPPERVNIPADVRERIVALRRDGLSYRAIAAELTEAGVPTARGGRWQAQTVRAAHLSML
jgi:DNA invertase Pin-like site-specific DNA recombinase